jgi:hypothetical protein
MGQSDAIVHQGFTGMLDLLYMQYKDKDCMMLNMTTLRANSRRSKNWSNSDYKTVKAFFCGLATGSSRKPR